MTRTCPQNQAAQIAVAYRLAGAQPEHLCQDGLMVCRYCAREMPNSARPTYALHAPDCLWVAARHAAGLEDDWA